MRSTSVICALSAVLAGCGYAVTTSTPSPGANVTAPVILSQPASQSVPMGLPATYTVNAAGTSPHYQWSRNGAPIAGANANRYVSPPTAFADTGANYVVTISNSAGTVTSATASLSVTARAPAAGDLRFQQVDAPSTVNGYGNGGPPAAASLSGLSAKTYALSFGTPFWTGASGNCTAASGASATACTWTYATVPLPASLVGPGLDAGFASDPFSNWEFDLADPNWPGGGNGSSPAAFSAVVNSIDLQPASQLFAVSWIQAPSNQQTAFSSQKHTVAAADLQAMVTAEGLSSRVITAASYNAGEITCLSYAWSADSTTVYEAEVSVAPAATASAAASSLAAEGYIITAIGRADDAGNIVMVGTRVAGDIMPRPYVIAQNPSQLQTMMVGGFAPVGVIQGAAQGGGALYIGER